MKAYALRLIATIAGIRSPALIEAINTVYKANFDYGKASIALQ